MHAYTRASFDALPRITYDGRIRQVIGYRSCNYNINKYTNNLPVYLAVEHVDTHGSREEKNVPEQSDPIHDADTFTTRGMLRGQGGGKSTREINWKLLRGETESTKRSSLWEGVNEVVRERKRHGRRGN